MGATICWGDDYISCTRGELNAIDMDMNHIPDAAMTIATAALFAKGTTTLRNIYNWRVKETDRLFAMATELRKVGAEVEEGHDYIRITLRKTETLPRSRHTMITGWRCVSRWWRCQIHQ